MNKLKLKELANKHPHTFFDTYAIGLEANKEQIAGFGHKSVDLPGKTNMDQVGCFSLDQDYQITGMQFKRTGLLGQDIINLGEPELSVFNLKLGDWNIHTVPLWELQAGITLPVPLLYVCRQNMAVSFLSNKDTSIEGQLVIRGYFECTVLDYLEGRICGAQG